MFLFLQNSLQYPKTVILHRRERASWGFSIVGGASDPAAAAAAAAAASNGVINGNSNGNSSSSSSIVVCEPIHVLFVVPDSPAAKDAKIK